MTNKLNIAVVGATSIKGEAFLGNLAKANLDIGKVFLLADEASAGDYIDFGNKELLVALAGDFDFTQVQHVILMGEPELSEYIYAAVEAAGCAVIDCSGFLGQRDDVSLATFMDEQDVASIVAIPEATTLQLWIVLQPILQQTTITQLHISVMQCAAQGGKAALEDLGQQTARLLNFQEAQPVFFEKQLAFNLIPRVGSITDNGETTTEGVIINQLARLFVMPRVAIDVTMMWTPVFYGDVVTVSLQTQDTIDMQNLASDWQANPLLAFSSTELQTPVSNSSGNSAINLSRLRERHRLDETSCISFCSISDPVHLCAEATMLVLKNQLMG